MYTNTIRRLAIPESFSRCLLTFTRTVRNPSAYHATAPASFAPKSVVLLSSPAYLNSTIDAAIKLFEEKELQIIVAGVDSVPHGGTTGVSELWMDEFFKVKDGIFLDEKDDLNKPPRQSDGVNVVGARKNWKLIDSAFSFKLAKNVDVSVNLANTAFVNDNLVTLFYLQPPQIDDETTARYSDRALCDLQVELPTSAHNAVVKVHDRWTALASEKPLFVTNCIGNLIKGLNGRSAAKFLEQNDQLMSIGSKDTEVYVKLYRENTEYRYQVIAGGGGWGPKADTLVVSPEAKVQKGDRIEFFMVTPENKKGQNEIEPRNGSFVFERINEASGFGHDSSEVEGVLYVFGCGTEVAYHVNNVLHLSAGETVVVEMGEK